MLIWLVQLVVYPSFKYLTADALLQWHRAYSKGITVVVMPLMVTQLGLHGWRCVRDSSLTQVWLLLLVVGTWVATAAIFVPLHRKIGANQAGSATLARLVAFNWLRTALWSAIFVIQIWPN